MLLSQWRPSIKSWLLAHTSIDSWDIAAPDADQMMGFLPPLESIDYRETDDGVIEGAAQQDIYIRKRYSGNPRYESLPISALEGFHASIGLRMVGQFQSINPELLRLDFEQVDSPVIVEEGGNGDFIVTLRFRVSIAWVVESEPEFPIDPPFDLQKIVLNIWRQKGDEFKEADRVRDYRLSRGF